MEDEIVARGDKFQNDLESTAYCSAGLGLTRENRATVDQVLDPKTVEVLMKMQKQGVYGQLAGCISTGKEANVYFGVNEDDSCVAVKVYKTSILGFRDRDEYVDGEHRFRHGYCRSNPRKMVALWAEKEQRNLYRLGQAGLHCPQVLRCKRNVLVMTLVGDPGKAAPRLKDVTSEPPTIGWLGVYLDVIRSMRRMYQTCRLVHGDLSEYNMLLHNERVYIIDVSQSVGTDHPRSLEFLKRDCLNINLFFSKGQLDGVIPLQALFGFIVQSNPPRNFVQPPVCVDFMSQEGMPSCGLTLSAPEEAWLRQLIETACESDQDCADDSVFMNTWVPASLAEAGDMCEVERVMADRTSGLSTVYDTLLETPSEDSGTDSEADESDESSSSDDGSSGDELDGEVGTGHDGHRPEGMSKQEWKKIVKEQKREQRKNKVPKHLKHKRNLKKYGCK
jgi:RIO kinase 1